MLDWPRGPAFFASQCRSNHLTSPANLYCVHGDDEVVQPEPHHLAPQSSQARPSTFSQSPPPDYTDLRDTLKSIQEEQVFFWAFVALRTPLFETLFKSAMMSFVECLLPRLNIPGLQGMARDQAGLAYLWWPTTPSSSAISFLIALCYSPSLCYFVPILRALCDSSMGKLVIRFGVWCLVCFGACACTLYTLFVIVFGVFVLGFSFV